MKSGFIGIIGRPNVGKSTLLNRLVGEKIAITARKPQTTRNRIMGIRNFENAQLIFLDTPGIHRAKDPLNRYMVDVAIGTLAGVDLVIFITEAAVRPHPDDASVIERLGNFKHPVILAINKIDAVSKEVLLPQIDAYRALYDFREIVPLSALDGTNVPLLTDLVIGLLPEGPRYFPEDQITDLPERFLAAEMIREKIIVLTREEVPYSTAVTIDSFAEDEKRNLTRIQAVIHVEKDSQKGILIGKSGSMLKEIGRQARLEMERFFAAKVFLELFVKVEKKWTQKTGKLREFGYE
jgi:GTP-binding protein Era